MQIQPLNHRDLVVATRLHALLNLAYAQEARLLDVRHFAPLDRTIEDLRTSDAYYLGALRDGELSGALSLGPDDEPDQICVATLVVHPAHQRQGIATALMHEALRRADGMAIAVAVATAARNAPALALYQQLGFAIYRRGTIGPEELELVKLRRPRAAP